MSHDRANPHVYRGRVVAFVNRRDLEGEMNTKDYVEKMHPTVVDSLVKEYADFSSVIGKHEESAIAHSQSALLAFVYQVKNQRQSITEREKHDFRHGFMRGYLYAMKIKEGEMSACWRCGNELTSGDEPNSFLCRSCHDRIREEWKNFHLRHWWTFAAMRG